MSNKTGAYIKHIAALPMAALPGWRHWYDVLFYAGYRMQKHLTEEGEYRLLDRKHKLVCRSSEEVCRAALAREKERGLKPESGHFVMMIPGLNGLPSQFRSFEKPLRKAGFEPMTVDFPSNRATVDVHAEMIGQLIAGLEDVETISFITHSFGGIILRKLLAENRHLHEKAKPGRILMIAPPHGGSFVADLVRDKLKLDGLYEWVCGRIGDTLTTEGAKALPPLKIPVGIMTADIGIEQIGDFLVAPDSSRIDLEMDYLRLTGSHTTMLWHPEAIRQSIVFLQEGRFELFPVSTSWTDRGSLLR